MGRIPFCHECCTSYISYTLVRAQLLRKRRQEKWTRNEMVLLWVILICKRKWLMIRWRKYITKKMKAMMKDGLGDQMMMQKEIETAFEPNIWNEILKLLVLFLFSVRRPPPPFCQNNLLSLSRLKKLSLVSEDNLQSRWWRRQVHTRLSSLLNYFPILMLCWCSSPQVHVNLDMMLV